MSDILRVLPATSIFHGGGHRVVGSTDLRGQGTHHALPDLGAFVLVDDVRGIEGRDQPPFGLHPHSGLVALSWFADGGGWISRCIESGYEELQAEAGEVLITVAGRGTAHDERTATDGTHEILQVIVRLPASARDLPASVTRHAPRAVQDDVLRLVHLPSLGISVDAVLYRCTPRGPLTLDLDDTHTTGFVFTREGAVRVGEVEVPEHHVAVLSGRGPLSLAPVGERCECIVGTSAPMDEPWVKLLGHSGFVVGPDEASVVAKLAAYAADPEHFRG